MSAAVPPLPRTSFVHGAQLSTGTTLLLPPIESVYHIHSNSQHFAYIVPPTTTMV